MRPRELRPHRASFVPLLFLPLIAGALAAQEPPAPAPTPTPDPCVEAIKTSWSEAVKEAGGLPQGNDEQEKTAYKKLVEAAAGGVVWGEACATDSRLAQAVAKGTASHASTLARSVNAAAANPRRVGLLERSGLIDFFGMALQGTNLVSADDTAVTINLNAAALIRRKQAEQAATGPLTAAERYRAAGFFNRLGGSLTFGAKVPEKEIVGFSGLPEAGKLFDAIVWDVKLRVLGDRDPRAKKWDSELVDLGLRGRMEATLVNLEQARPAGALLPDAALMEAMRSLGTRRVEDARRTIGGSWQASLKFSGQHLTEQAGMNKYAATLLVDKGLGSADFTLNATFSAAHDVPAGAAQPLTLKQWQVAAGLSGTFLQDVIVPDRGVEWALSGEALAPVDDPAELPMQRKRTWKADLALTFPVTKSAQLPFSITYTNDPNNLAKQKFVRGRIGITYDFSSLANLAGAK